MLTMLEEILDILTAAVTCGGVEVVKVKQGDAVSATYKDAAELVTQADTQSDAAMLALFHARLSKLDPTISFHLEESGVSGVRGSKIAGADPLDGTNHFACGGNLYSVQAHYMEHGVPLVGVILQPEVYFPLEETAECVGRLAFAVRGCGAFLRRSVFRGDSFDYGQARRLQKRYYSPTRTYTACVPLSTKMTPEERARAMRVHAASIVGSTTGTGGAGGNVMMVILGGQQVYANFGAGEDLDLAPAQVIAEEAGMTVWGIDRHPPVWNLRKQHFVVAPSPQIAEDFFRAAGL